MATLADLRSRFQLMAADDGTYWSTAEIDTWLNDAQRDFAARTLSVRASSTIALSNATPTYNLPTGTIRILRVTLNNAPLYRENEFRMDRLAPTWMSSTGTPSAYLYGLDGATTVRFYPTPNGSMTATVYVAKTPSDLANTSDVSTIPQEYHHALVLYALSKAFLKDGDMRNPEKANIWWQQYLEQAALATDYVTKALNRGQMSGFDGTPGGAVPQGGN